MTTHRPDRLFDRVMAALGGVPVAALPLPLPGTGANARRVALALRIARLRAVAPPAPTPAVVVPVALAVAASAEVEPAEAPVRDAPPAPAKPRRAIRATFSSVSLDDAAMLLAAATDGNDAPRPAAPAAPKAAAPGDTAGD